MVNRWRRAALLPAPTALGLVLSQGAWAQDGAQAAAAASAAGAGEVQTVVVTAERRTQDLQKTPVSITVLDGDTLARENRTDVQGIVQGVAGVVFQAVKPDGSPVVSMRGVGTDNPLGNPGVAMYVDGVVAKQGAFQFFDVERVEVLRGPQGTLYGRGAPAGAINFITRDPDRHLGTEGTLGGGNHGLVQLTAIGNVPLSQDWALRVGVNAEKRDGYYANGLSDSDQQNARVKLKYAPSKALSAVFSVDAYRNRSSGDGQVTLDADGSIPAGRVSNAPTTDGLGVHDDSLKATAGVDWDFGPATLTYLGAYANYREDATTYFGGNTNRAKGRKDDAQTHELRVAGNGSGPLAWLAGVYAQDSRLDAVTDITNAIFSGAFYNATRSTSRAIFAEATWALDEDWRFTLGGRRSHDTYASNFPQTFDFLGEPPPGGFPDLDFASVPSARKFSHTDYKLRAERSFGKDSMVYATVASGYRPGGAAGNGDGTVQAYGIEVNRALEIGTKNRLLGGRLQVNAEAYAYHYSGFQQTFQAPGSPFVSIVAHPARMAGGELEMKAALSPVDELSFDAALLHARYSDTELKMPHSARATLGLGYRHDFSLASGATVRAGGDVTWQSSSVTNYSATVDPGMHQGATTIANASVNYESTDGRFDVTGYVRNATDRVYKLTVNQVQGGNDTATLSAPRTFGVVFGWKF